MYAVTNRQDLDGHVRYTARNLSLWLPLTENINV